MTTVSVTNTFYSPQDLAWAYLSRVAEGPCNPLNDLIAEVGAEEAAHIIASGEELPFALERKVSARRGWNRAQDDLECACRNGFRLLTPDDPQWPQDKFHPFVYSAMQARAERDAAAAAPYTLWVKGDISILQEPSLAVVGSRLPSRSSERITETLCRELCAENIALVSGMALGVDAIVHRTALDMQCPTVAVVACGLDQVYPAAHCSLAQHIARAGLIVSEYPPQTRPARYRFLARNRLLAAFSQGVLVTSASWRSGALNTASWARDLGLPVMATPHDMFDADGAGCHRLIREQATLVTRASEIVEEIGVMGQLSLPFENVDTPLDALTNRDKTVWNAVSPFYASSCSAIAAESGMSRDEVLVILRSLKVRHLVDEQHGRWIRIKD